MTPRTLLLLGALAVGAVGVAGGLALRRTAPATAPLVAGQLMFPGLVDRLQAAQRVEITSKDTTFTLVREGDRWGDAGRGGYPVQQNRVREMFSGLTELRLTEPRTADPEQLKALNVDEPGPDSSAVRLVVRDGDGGVIAQAILGRRRVRMAGNLPEAIYVRRAGENQAWLAEGTLRVDAERNLWLDRDLFDVKRARVAAAQLRQADSFIRLARPSPTAERLELENPPEGWRGDENKLDDIGRALEWLTFEDVAPRTEITNARALGSASWTLFDGTAITARVFDQEGQRWTAFEVAWTAPVAPVPEGAEQRSPEVAQREAEAAAKRFEGWVYELPDWKLAVFLATLDSMRAEPPPAPAAPAPAAPGPAPAAPAPAAPAPETPAEGSSN